MAEANIVSETGGDAAEGRTANLIYILYLLSLIFGITSLVGLVMAYINKGDAPEWVQSHYRFQIRTFWIGLLYLAIGSLLTLIYIGWLLVLLWYVRLIVRCARGMRRLSRAEAHPNPRGWLFG